MQGRLTLPGREGRSEIRHRDPADEIDFRTLGRRMVTSLQCEECPHPRFEGPGMWNAYARHLRTAHPQTIPTPPQRVPDPPAAKSPLAPVGEKEAPVMADNEEICPVPGCGKRARHGARHRNQGSKSNGGGPAVAEQVAVRTPSPEDLSALLAEKVELALQALDEYGWHLEGCPAYDAGEGEGKAHEVDNRGVDCSCGFRMALDGMVPA